MKYPLKTSVNETLARLSKLNSNQRISLDSSGNVSIITYNKTWKIIKTEFLGEIFQGINSLPVPEGKWTANPQNNKLKSWRENSIERKHAENSETPVQESGKYFGVNIVQLNSNHLGHKIPKKLSSKDKGFIVLVTFLMMDIESGEIISDSNCITEYGLKYRQVILKSGIEIYFGMKTGKIAWVIFPKNRKKKVYIPWY